MDYDKELLLFKHPLTMTVGSGCMVSNRIPFLPNFGPHLVKVSLDYFPSFPQAEMLASKAAPMYKLFDETLIKWSRVTAIEVYHNKELKFILCVHELPDPSTGDSIAIIKYELNVPEDINNGHVMPTFRLPWMFLCMKEDTERMQYARLHDLVRTLILKSLTLNGEFFKGKLFSTKEFG